MSELEQGYSDGSFIHPERGMKEDTSLESKARKWGKITKWALLSLPFFRKRETETKTRNGMERQKNCMWILFSLLWHILWNSLHEILIRIYSVISHYFSFFLLNLFHSVFRKFFLYLTTETYTICNKKHSRSICWILIPPSSERDKRGSVFVIWYLFSWIECHFT